MLNVQDMKCYAEHATLLLYPSKKYSCIFWSSNAMVYNGCYECIPFKKKVDRAMTKMTIAQ